MPANRLIAHRSTETLGRSAQSKWSSSTRSHLTNSGQRTQHPRAPREWSTLASGG